MKHSKMFTKSMKMYEKERAKLVGPKDTINYNTLKISSSLYDEEDAIYIDCFYGAPYFYGIRHVMVHDTFVSAESNYNPLSAVLPQYEDDGGIKS